MTSAVNRDFSTCGSFSKSWQAQHFVNLEVQISWRVQYSVDLEVQISEYFVDLEVQNLWQASTL